MPIQLTTPLSPGVMDPGTVYDHCRISRQTYDDDREMVIFNLDYGTIDGENWIAGQLQPSSDSTYPSNHIIDGDAYVAWADHDTLAGEKTRAAAKRSFYEVLQASYPALAGTIV